MHVSPPVSVGRRCRFAVVAVVAVVCLAGTGLHAQQFTDIVDSTGLSGPIDDFTTHTYALRASGSGTFVDMLVIRRFSQPIEDITVTIEGGQADDIGYVGGTLVTDVKPSCAGVGAVPGPIDVTDQVTVDGDEARLLLRAEENCCCWTGWGSATEAGRADARLHWQVTLGEPQEFRVNMTTFLPTVAIEGPPQALCMNLFRDEPGRPIQKLYFEGDGNRAFSPSATTFRTRQLVTLVVDETVDADGIKDGSYMPMTGVSRAYAADAFDDGVLDENDNDGILHDCHLLHDEAQADPESSMSIESVRPVGGMSALVRLRGDARLPLISGAPGIGWDLFVQVDASSDPPRYTVVGAHDGFPAYELYINDFMVYSYHPGPGPYTFLRHLRRLFAPLDVGVNEVGTLPSENLRTGAPAFRAHAVPPRAVPEPVKLAASLDALVEGLNADAADARYVSLVQLQISAMAGEENARLLGDLAPALIERLGDAEPRVRQAAAATLGMVRPSLPAAAVRPLLRRMGDPEPEVRVAALGALAHLPRANRRVASSLLDRLLEDPEASVRNAAARALGDLGGGRRDVVDGLTVGLADDNAYVRSEAARSLGKLGPAARAAVPALERLARTPGQPEIVRRQAEHALRSIAGGASAPEPGRNGEPPVGR